MTKKTVVQNGLGIIKTVYGKNNPLLENVKDFAVIRAWGDKNKAITADGEEVERQEYLYAEGYGLVKCIPTELHFIFEDKSKKIGRWVFMCFPSDTKVEMLDGYKNIQDVKVGDSVLTHTGNHRKVSKTFHHHYTGKWATIKIRGNRTIECTAGHRFLVNRGGEFSWVSAEELLTSDLLVESVPNRSDLDFYEYYYSNGNGTFSETMPIDEDVCRLFGYYLSEGYLVQGKDTAKRKRYVVHFALHKSETHYAQDIQELMFKYFGVRGGVYQSSENGIRLNFTTQKGYTLFDSLFGKLAWNKSIPHYISKLPHNKIKQLLTGYWRGDGSSTSQGYSFSSTSYALIHQAQKMLLSLGISSGISSNTANDSKFSLIGSRKIVRRHSLYSLSIYGNSADRLGEMLGHSNMGRGANKIIVNEGRVEYPVISVELSEVTDMPVYNLEVENDHSYHVNGVVAHNCSCGSPAGIISYNELKSLMTVQGTESGYILACLAGVTSKQNVGVYRHADGSTE